MLSPHLNPFVKIPTPKDTTRLLLKEAADQFNVKPEDILGDRQYAEIVTARHYFWYLLKRVKGWSNSRIAEQYNMNPTTVRSALKNFRHKYGGDFAPKPSDNENNPRADWSN